MRTKGRQPRAALAEGRREVAMLLQVLGIVAVVVLVLAVGASLADSDAERDELRRKYVDRW